MRVREALSDAATRLQGDTARLDAELLMAHALGATREDILLKQMDAEAPMAFEALMERRLADEPVAYITGRKAFWTIELAVGSGVLIPRPDSESLIEAAVAHFGEQGPTRILDLGTGSGALLLAALDQWPAATGIGVDMSFEAIRIARANVRRLGMRSRARILRSDWMGAGGPHDLILCNPPYIAAGAALPREVGDFEPAMALYAGRDGLDDYRMIAPVLATQLAAGGVACFEVGAGQASDVRALFAAEGFTIESRNDLNGVERCLVITA